MAVHVRMKVTYRMKAPYAVQGPGEYGSLVDQGVERGPDGWPLIPASSWRGRTRAHLEALLRGLGVPVCHPPHPAATCPHDQAVREQLTQQGRTFCTVCELFGSPWLPSRVRFGDLIHPGAHDPEQAVPVGERTNVAVNRFLGSVEEQRLVVYQTAGVGFAASSVPSPEEDPASLTGSVHAFVEPYQAGLLAAALRLPSHLGGKKARGLGLAEEARLKVSRQDQPGGAWAEVDAGELDAWIEKGLQEVERLALSGTL